MGLEVGMVTFGDGRELLDSIGMAGPAWDLDSDGIVTLEDLGILLRVGVDCE